MAEIMQETPEQRLARLEAENDALRQRLARKNASTLRCKVSEKGAVSLYGLNARFPVTLYPNQWETVLNYGPEILSFMAENRDSLSWGKQG